jgi:hypothetical protein
MPYRERFFNDQSSKREKIYASEKTKTNVFFKTVFCIANLSELGACANLALPK